MTQHASTEAIYLRDRFFELSGRPRSSDDEQRFRARVEACVSTPQFELDGLALCFHPSARFRALRFVEAARIAEPLRGLFARPVAQLPNLAAVFVDPEEFSYRSFENILPLDRYFEGLSLACALEGRKKLGPSREARAYSFSLACAPELRDALLGLDALDLYLDPLNAASRGGRRYIFHCARLAEALEQAVRAALPKRWLAGFTHVNPVFRCNRFEPGDHKFARHVDTPYYDASRKQVSRYTLLIYLTGGQSESSPALQIGDDITLAHIDAMTCVVFGQALPHEGAAFESGRKVFLRTELIYEGLPLQHEPWIAELFAKACYWTGESVFEPQLARATHELYDRAAAAHWGQTDAARGAPDPWVHKHFRGLDFITDGFEFWFAKQGLSVPECAALALLDVLNCKLGTQSSSRESFRKLCTREQLEPRGAPSEWIPALLERYAQRSPSEPVMTTLELDLLFPDSEAVDADMCCPFHCYSTWDPSRAGETVELFERAQRYAKRRISGAPIQIMGQELFLDPSKFVVEHGKIHVLSEQALAPVNFAACWNDGSDPSNYLDVEVVVEAPKLLLPPILYVEHEHGVRLFVDLFRNSWMVSHEQRTVPVPRFRTLGIAEYDSGDFETTPWLDAAERSGASFDEEPEADDEDDEDGDDEDDGDDTWWSDRTIVRELYRDGDE